MSSITNRIRLVTGDITHLPVDAIVTAANRALMGGGGVDGAVHRAAGPELVAASRQLTPCPTGEARITPGFGLSASHVIHAVGPVYTDGKSGEPDLLAAAYRNSLALAAENQLATIAFPCISTGVYGYPSDAACRVAIATVHHWLQQHALPAVVTFCCFRAPDAKLYSDRLTELGISMAS